MSAANQVKQTTITSLVSVLGHGEIFSRVTAEIQRANTALPNATGADKKARVEADLKIIFNDVVLPVGKSVMNLLIELGVAWVSLNQPELAIPAKVVGTVAETELNK